MPCQEHLGEVASIPDWFAETGVDVAVASFAPPTTLEYYQSIFEWPFPLYADPDRSVYRAFRLRRLPLWRLIAPRVLSRYSKLIRSGRKLQRRYGREDVFQGGGDFLVTPDGLVPYAHRSDDPADRPSLGMLRHEIVTALARVRD